MNQFPVNQHRRFLRVHTIMAAAIVALGIATGHQQLLGQPPASQRRDEIFHSFPRVMLVSRDPVQVELALTTTQKQAVKGLLDELRPTIVEARKDGDSDKLLRIVTSASVSLAGLLSDDQNARLNEIFIQANGPNALLDAQVSKRLELTDDQIKLLAAAREVNQRSYAEVKAAQGNFPDLSKARRLELENQYAEIRRQAIERMLSILSEAQRERVEAMKGAKFQLPVSISGGSTVQPTAWAPW
ncbi:MAG: hypothetical protein KDB23_14495 [Planctomycetales bacterium]|nr:hypothetical protein [Planctomycetales bacterium]